MSGGGAAYVSPDVRELSVGAAWSGSASPPHKLLPAALHARPDVPFALSTDSSDSASDRDLSLMLMENELSEMKGMLHAACSVSLLSHRLVS